MTGRPHVWLKLELPADGGTLTVTMNVWRCCLSVSAGLASTSPPFVEHSAPVVQSLFNTLSGSVMYERELLIDSGSSRCDLYLPVRDIIQL